MNNIIQFINVTKRYNDLKALNKSTFNVKINSFTALAGNNGSGKTTTINILCNLIRYDSGEVNIFGNRIVSNDNHYRSRFGIVLCNSYAIEVFNISEYLKFVCKFQNVPSDKAKSRIEDLIELFDMSAVRKKPISSLSSGMKMCVSLAAALIHDPEILVFDEPFIHLDIENQEKVISILEGLRSKKTLFITSHNLELVTRLCTHFLIIRNGEIISEIEKVKGDTETILKERIKSNIIRKDKNYHLDWLM